MRLLQFLKYPQTLQRNDKESKKDVLFEMSVDATGSYKYDGELITTKKNERYKIFKIAYLQPNGVSAEIDRKNHKKMRLLFDTFSSDLKLSFPKEKKNSLSQSIEYYGDKYEAIEHEGKQEILLNRIRLMNIWNDTKYVSMIMFVKVQDIDKFKKATINFLNVEEYSQEETIDLLSMLNNEME